MPKECYEEILSQADNWEVKQGKRWYNDAREKLVQVSQETGISLEKCAGIVAVLSPMVEWSLNLKAAIRFIKSKGKARGPGFAENYAKARVILKQGDFSVIRGPKVKAFYCTLCNPAHGEPVIDTQMIAAFWKGKAYRDDFKVVSQSEKRLEPIRQAVKELAEERRENVGQTQAIIWITFKRLNSEYANQLKLWI